MTDRNITSSFSIPLPTGTEDDILVNLKRIYSNLELSADHLQFWVVALVRELSDLPKKEAKEHPALTYLFRNAPKGMDRGTMAAWIKEYTPLRPQFEKGNGHYKGCGFAKKPVWDIEGATSNPWYSADPESTRKTPEPNIRKKVEAVLREAAKLVAISDDISVQEAAEQIRSMVSNAEATITKELDSDAVSQFVDKWAESLGNNATMH